MIRELVSPGLKSWATLTWSLRDRSRERSLRAGEPAAGGKMEACAPRNRAPRGSLRWNGPPSLHGALAQQVGLPNRQQPRIHFQLAEQFLQRLVRQSSH